MMEILSYEFKNWLRRKIICHIIGHKESDWLREEWAPAHSTGYRVKICRRCHIEIDRTPSREEMEAKLSSMMERTTQIN